MNRDFNRDIADKLKNFEQVWKRVEQSKKQNKIFDKSALMPKNRRQCNNVRYCGKKK